MVLTNQREYPAGASFESRALPLDTLDKTYKTYEAVAPVHAYAGPAIPWFEQPGGGTQYALSKSIKQLLADKKLERNKFHESGKL